LLVASVMSAALGQPAGSVVFHTDAALFRTGWFVESLATQTLVIFVIRTAGRPWRSPPSRAFALGVGSSLAVELLLSSLSHVAMRRQPA